MKRKLNLREDRTNLSPEEDCDLQNDGNKKRRLSESQFSDYEILDQEAEETYGTILRAKHKPSGETVAIKRIKIDVGGEGISASTIREVSILQALSHPNIIALYAWIVSVHHVCLVFEFMEMDLRKYIESTSPSQLQIQTMTVALLSGMNHCLNNGIYHRDLKPQNILVDNDGKIKIAEFGLSREVLLHVTDPLTPAVATLWYRCPELLLGVKVYGYGVDSWALGCIIGEFFYKKPLFHGTCEVEQLFTIFQHLGTPTEKNWKDIKLLKHYSNQFPRWGGQGISTLLENNACAEVIDLIGGLLRLDPRRRLTPHTALKHSYCKMTPTQLESLESLSEQYCSE